MDTSSRSRRFHLPAAPAMVAVLALFVVETPIARADPASSRATARPVPHAGRAPSRAVATWPQFHATADHLGVQSTETRLSPSTASELAMGWKVVTGGSVWSSAAVVGGVVYFGSSDYRFRGRMKSSSTGAAFNYSAAQTITVS